MMNLLKHDKIKQKKLELAGFAASWCEDDVLNDINNVDHTIETAVDKLEDENEIPPHPHQR